MIDSLTRAGPPIHAPEPDRGIRRLKAARLCCEGDGLASDRAASFVQRAAKEPTTAVLTCESRQRNDIAELAGRLSPRLPDRVCVPILKRSTAGTVIPPEPESAASEVRAWTAKLGTLKAGFGRWLAAAREAAS